MGKKIDPTALMERVDRAACLEQAVPAVRDIETITAEILTLKQNAGDAIIGIGQRLIEAKEMLPHGAWLPWLEEQVEFSERTARNFMRERDEARLAAEAAQADAKSAAESRAKMEADMVLLKEQCRSFQDAVSAAQKELEELKARPVDVAVMAVDQEKIDAARSEAVAEMQAKVDKAKAARDKAEEKRKEAESALAAVRAKLEEAGKAERKAAIAGDSDLAVFQLLFGQAQEIANKLHGLLIKAQGREDGSQAAGMQKALSKLAELIGKAAEV